MKMKKRIAATAILTAAVMALSAGCGQKAAPTEGTGENAGSAKEKVEIEYWALPYGPSDTYAVSYTHLCGCGCKPGAGGHLQCGRYPGRSHIPEWKGSTEV